METKMHPTLAAYAKHYPTFVGGILETYNGDRDSAVQAINTLFKSVEKKKPYLPPGHVRLHGGGVGFAELDAAAEIGIALGNGPLENIIGVIIKEDSVLTVENAREILKRLDGIYKT